MKRFLNLYPEDFERYYIWEQICDCLGVSYDAVEIILEVKNVDYKTEDDLEEEEE